MARKVFIENVKEYAAGVVPILHTSRGEPRIYVASGRPVHIGDKLCRLTIFMSCTDHFDVTTAGCGLIDALVSRKRRRRHHSHVRRCPTSRHVGHVRKQGRRAEDGNAVAAKHSGKPILKRVACIVRCARAYARYTAASAQDFQSTPGGKKRATTGGNDLPLGCNPRVSVGSPIAPQVQITATQKRIDSRS